MKTTKGKELFNQFNQKAIETRTSLGDIVGEYLDNLANVIKVGNEAFLVLEKERNEMYEALIMAYDTMVVKGVYGHEKKYNQIEQAIKNGSSRKERMKKGEFVIIPLN